MTKRRIVVVSVACALLAVFGVRTQSKTPGADQQAKSSQSERTRDANDRNGAKGVEDFFQRLRNMTPDQQIRAIEKRARERAIRNRQLRPQRVRKVREIAKEVKKQHEEFVQEFLREWKEAGGLLWEKRALMGLGTSQEQWKLIQPKLGRVRQLRLRANSTVGLFLAGGSSDQKARRGVNPTIPALQWKRPWKGKAPDELTEAQKLAKRLIALVERKNVAPGTLERTMEALRKARRQEAVKLEPKLSEARQQLRKALTAHQEAALVLMNSF
jgi:hypothetical protein